MNVNVWFVNERIIIFVVPLLIVPTELTEDTEAYGLKLFESRMAYASRGKNPEMIACGAPPSATQTDTASKACWACSPTKLINEPSPCLMFLCSLVLKYIPCLLFFCSPVFKISPVSHVPLFSCLNYPPR